MMWWKTGKGCGGILVKDLVEIGNRYTGTLVKETLEDL